MVFLLLPLRGRLAFRWWEWALLVTIAGPVLGLTYAIVESLGVNSPGPRRALLYALHKQRACGGPPLGSGPLWHQSYQPTDGNPGPLVYVQTVYQRAPTGTKAFVVIAGETTIHDAWFKATADTEGWWYYACTKDKNPPVGAQLFWWTDNDVKHIATYVGGGKVVTNVTNERGAVKLLPASELDTWGAYIGWAEPYYGR